MLLTANTTAIFVFVLLCMYLTCSTPISHDKECITNKIYYYDSIITSEVRSLKDWIAARSQCVLSASTPALSCGQMLSNCSPFTKIAFYYQV